MHAQGGAAQRHPRGAPVQPPARPPARCHRYARCADFGSVLRSFTSFGRHEALLTLGLGGLMLVGAMLFEPVAAAAWERQNEGVRASG